MTGKFNSFGGLGDTPVQEGSAKKPKARKVADKPLEELYQLAIDSGKVTPSVRKAIIAKEDFTSIQQRYCEVVCGLCAEAKRPRQARLQNTSVDIAIIQDHNAVADKYKTSEQMEQITRDILGFLATKYFQGLTYSVLGAVKCVPSEKDLRGASLTSTKVTACSAYLMEELRQIKPKVIISLTTNVNKVLGTKLSSTSNRGEFHPTEFGTMVVTLHPKVLTMIRQNASGKAWGPDYLEVIDRDFKKAANIARGELKVVSLDEALKKASEQIVICRSVEQVREEMGVIKSFPNNKIISFDLETTSLDPWAEHAKIITAQFGYSKADGEIRAVVIPLWHRENVWFNADEAWPYIAEILLSDLPKVGHNIKFDIIYTFVQKQIRVVNAAFDTLLLLHAMNSGLKGNYSLKKGVWDFLPETGLGGYEDKLPALSVPPGDEDDGAEDPADEPTEA